jgi:translation elongation factor EF-4
LIPIMIPTEALWHIRVMEGSLSVGDEIQMMSSGEEL